MESKTGNPDEGGFSRPPSLPGRIVRMPQALDAFLNSLPIPSTCWQDVLTSAAKSLNRTAVAVSGLLTHFQLHAMNKGSQ